MELLERESCIAELQAHLLDARAGHGRVVLLGGEAGAGKSMLVRRFADQAATSTRVLIGGCDPLAHPQPLGPLRDVVTELGGAVGDLIRDHERRPELFRAVLDALSATGSTVFVIEDVHWADEATLDLLRYLGRRIGTTRALVIATYRDDEVGGQHPFRFVLGDLATSTNVRRMSVPPLSESAVRQLAEGSAIDPAAQPSEDRVVTAHSARLSRRIVPIFYTPMLLWGAAGAASMRPTAPACPGIGGPGTIARKTREGTWRA